MENLPTSEYFKKPEFNDEFGEFQRTAEVFGIDESALLFLAEEGQLEVLSEEAWFALENTDSFDIEIEDWKSVEEHSTIHEVRRDWESIKEAMESGHTLPAPIILRSKERYYLVSGNTRLMVSRAIGIAPKVWVFEIN